MKWFKFYAQDWMTDTKIMRLVIEQRLCYITLLCLAAAEDKDGLIHDLDEDSLIQLTHLFDNPYETENEVSRARGCLNKFIQLGMLERINENTYFIKNFSKRQGSNLTGYERVKKYRKKHKQVINDNNNDNANDNARLDKIRLDKNNIYTAGQAGRTKNNVELLTDFYFALKGWEDQPKSFYKKNGISYGRNCKSAKDILTLCDESLEKAKEKVEKVKKWAEGRGLEWSLETVSKKFLEV